MTGREISRLLEHPAQGRMLKMLDLLSPSFIRKITAKKIYSACCSIEMPVYKAEIPLQLYTGNNHVAGSIADYLESRSHPALKCAIVHGSIGNQDEVAYSDFDGILIIDLKRLENAYSVESLLEIIDKTTTMMYRQDPLQHHGWMILNSADLGDYPAAEIPLHLLTDGKLIYPRQTFTLLYADQTRETDWQYPFVALCNSLLKKTKDPSGIKTFYQFKLYLSQCLLIPALYFQAKENLPVRKKESFNRLAELPLKVSGFIQEVIAIRRSWNQDEVKNVSRFSARTTLLPERYKKFISNEKLAQASEAIAMLRNTLSLRS